MVDDSVVSRRLITTALEKDATIKVVASAPNGLIGIEKVKQHELDLVLMDVEMPEMDGITAVRELKKIRPNLPIIMFSALTREGASVTLEALSAGAASFVEKPGFVKDLDECKSMIYLSLVPKIKEVIASKGAMPSQKFGSNAPGMGSTPPANAPVTKPAPEPQKNIIRTPAGGGIDIVAIGVSTGGPNALAELMPTLPADLSVPVVIVQHMPPIFTANLAKRLDNTSPISIKEAEVGDVLAPGKVFLAPGGYHMIVEAKQGQHVIGLNLDPHEEGCRPAVNVLFRSVAALYGANVLSVILTGMGKDGLEGSQAILNAGGSLIAQDEASSVVWGMPGAVARAGLPEKILPLNQIGMEIIRRVRHSMALNSRPYETYGTARI